MFSNVKYMKPHFLSYILFYCGIWNSPTLGREVGSCLKKTPLLFGKIHWLISMFPVIWYRHQTESTASGRKASRSLRNLRASDASHRSPVHIILQLEGGTSSLSLVTDVRSLEGLEGVSIVLVSNGCIWFILTVALQVCVSFYYCPYWMKGWFTFLCDQCCQGMITWLPISRRLPCSKKWENKGYPLVN